MQKSSIRTTTAAVAVALCAGLLASPVTHAADDPDPASAYVAAVRQSLERGKRFPTGREVSLEQPSGRSEVTFVLSRAGKISGVKTTRSSYSQPLDDMARQLVTRAKYAAFPADAWAGSPSHQFVVTYNFNREPTGKVTIGEPVEVKAP